MVDDWWTAHKFPILLDIAMAAFFIGSSMLATIWGGIAIYRRRKRKMEDFALGPCWDPPRKEDMVRECSDCLFTDECPLNRR